jgi:isoleucyl-tRNA synthetase
LLVAGETILKTEVLIEKKAKPGLNAGDLDGIVAALDTTLNSELRREGLLRELVNRVQQRRKEMKLNLSDRIKVTYAAGGVAAEILKAEAAKPSALSEETLATAWSATLPDGEGGREEFTEHGDSWIAFRLDVA